MGYQTGRSSIVKVQEKLKLLLLASTDIEFPTEDNTLLAYQLREAIFAAKYHDDLKEIAKLAGKYKILKKPGKVVMRLRYSTSDILSPTKISLEEVKTLSEVLTAIIKHKSFEMYFSNVRLTEEETKKLYHWLFINNYFMIYDEESGLTVTKIDPGESKWTPVS